MTAKKREIIFMPLCLLKTANYANVLPNREYHEIYVLMFLCLLDTKAAQKL